MIKSIYYGGKKFNVELNIDEVADIKMPFITLFFAWAKSASDR